MSKPTQGRNYTVVSGDTLSSIAAAAYGTASKSSLIWKANANRSKSGDRNVIFPGEIFFLPVDQVEKEARQDLSGDDIDKPLDTFTIICDGKELLLESATVRRSIDEGVAAWSGVMAWDPEDDEIERITAPYSYSPAAAYLGPRLAVDGFLYTTRPVNGARLEKHLYGFSPTADFVDSNPIRPPYEQKKVNLKDRIESLAEPFGLSVVYDLESDEIFKRVKIEPTDGLFDHCAELVSQRAALLTVTPRGELHVVRANTGGRPVATLRENVPPARQIEIEYNGRERFNVYKMIGQTPRKPGNVATAIDSVVTRPRALVMSAPDTTSGNIQDAANWRRSKQLAEALGFPLPVDSWYVPNTSDLWLPNTIVTVQSPVLYPSSSFDFLIRGVEYHYTATGNTAILHLVPPQVYTGEQLIEPWAEAG